MASIVISRTQLLAIAAGSSLLGAILGHVIRGLVFGGGRRSSTTAATADHNIAASITDIAASLKALASVSHEQLVLLKEQHKRIVDGSMVQAASGASGARVVAPPTTTTAPVRHLSRTRQPAATSGYETESDAEDIFEDLPTTSIDIQAPSDTFDVHSLFAEIDNKRASDDPLGALALLESRVSQFPATERANVLWRQARGMFDKSERDKANRQQLLVDARTLAEEAIKLDPNNADAHKWLAVSAGAYSDYETLSGKLECGSRFKQHIQEAIRLRPTDPGAHYLLGRWCIEVAGLSWLQKKACAAIVGTPPESTYEEALECFTKSENLRPNAWKSNQLMIAKTLVKMGKKSDAKSWLSKALAIPTVTLEDRGAQEEAKALHASL